MTQRAPRRIAPIAPFGSKWIAPMRMFAPFAVFFLSALGAKGSLIELKDPAKIAGAFSRRAEVRLVNVWATWCVPCVEEMSDLRAIATAFGPQVAIVGVSLDDMIPGDRSTIKQHVLTFLQQRSIEFPQVYYAGKSDALADYLRFDGVIPITIAFDRTGKEL